MERKYSSWTMIPKDVHILTLKVCFLIWQKEFCIGNLVKNFEKKKKEFWDGEIILDYLVGPNVITRVLIRKQECHRGDNLKMLLLDLKEKEAS